MFIKVPTTEKIHPQEIEAVLEQHAGVAEAAVCGLPEKAGGERIVVSTRDDAEAAQLFVALVRNGLTAPL